MKHIFGSSSISRVFLIACVTLFNLLAHGQTVTLVQSGSVQGLNVSSVAAPFPSGNTQGNLIIAFVRMDTTTQSVTITDSAGNSFVRAVTQSQSTDGHQISLFYAKNIRAGSNTVTATFSAANAHSWLAIYEYQGLGTNLSLDQTAHGSGKNKSATTGNTAATTNANELLFAAVGLPYNYAGTATAGTGFVLQQQNTASARAATETEIVGATGTYAGTFSLSANANWSAVIATFIAGPAITTSSVPAATQSAAYSSTLAASGKAPYTWSIISGSLPSGLSLSSSTGTITGTPTASGSNAFTVQVTDANGNSASKALSINVNAPPVITTTALPTGRLTLAYSATLQASGGTAPLTWSIASGSLPAGLTLNATTGMISGTPTAAGVSNFTAQVTDVNTAAGTQALSTTVYGPLIDSLSPSFGAIGTSVTIAGTLFGSSQGTSTVTFNGVPGTPTGWGVDTVMVPVPAGASSGPVVVTVGGVASNGFLFTLAPQIASINPTSGAAGISVTITGSGFGATQDTSRVTFNGVPATATSWNDTSIVATVPSAASTGMISVTVGSASSNGVAFTISPSISSISPASGVAGTVVTVLGSNFGSARGTITFAAVNAVPSFWSSSKIVVPVPAGAVTGPVVVTAAGQSSNGVSFAVGTGSLTGIVSRASDGTPVSGALVEALQSNTVKSSITTDTNGSYTISALAPGAYDLRVSATGYGTALQAGNQVTAGGSTTVNASLDASGTIAGTVTRSDGATGISGATVAALVGSDTVGSATTDNSGNYIIASLAVAAYQVQVSASGYNSQNRASVSVTAGNTTTANFNLSGQTVISYQYDELGRLVGVVDSQQGAASYTYDAVGNITAISRFSPGQVSVIDFTPKRGPAGTTVTISGTGFSDTALQDTVTFNGSSASVSSATTTQLVTTVPAGATTGPISITSPNGSATSGSSFTVTADTGAPTITGFTPTIGNVGTAVTVSGTNFESAASDKVKFNISLASVSAATSTSISTSVPAGTGSGRITVSTPMGKGVSNDDFFIPPSSYTPANVAFTGRMAFGTPFTGNIPTAGQIGLVVFDATAGQSASIQITGSTLASATVSINQPNGSTLTSLNIAAGSSYLNSTVLPVTGTYTILVVATNTSTGSLTLNLTADAAGSIVPGAPVNVTTTAAGQNARYTFSGTTGQQVSINLSNSTYTGCYSVVVNILKPDGSSLGSVGVCNSTTGFLDSLTLPNDGTYTVLIDPQGANTGSITVLLNSFADVTGSITAGTPVTGTTTTPGQNLKYTFSGTSGQQVSVNLSGSTYTGCNAVVVSILKPDGSSLGSVGICNNTSGYLDSLTLPTDGAYTVFVNPQGTATGSITVLLNSFADVTGTITPGTPLTATTTAVGQNARYTFSGTTGQQVSINLTGSTYTGCNAVVVSILKPDGSTLGSVGICNNSSGFLDSLMLPSDGTYTVFVNPQGTTTGSITLLLNTFADVIGTITAGTPLTATTTTPGQNAKYTFAGTTGQQVSINLSGSTYTGCNAVVVSILKPDGSTLGSVGICNNTSGFLDSLTLPSDSTYTVFVNPQGTTTGSITLVLNSFADVTGTITPGTPLTATTTAVGQNARYTFSGTTGQQVSINLSGSTYTGCNAVVVSILKPDGSTLGSVGICNNTSGFLDSLTLPTTGTYTVLINPQGTTIGSITVLLNSFADVTGAITAGTPLTATTDTSGQNAKYTFSGTTGQQVSLNLSGSTYTGCNAVVASILKPDGSTLGSVGICNNTSGFLDSLTLPADGTYTVFINPQGATTGSITVVLNVFADLTGTLTIGSPATITTTVAGQNARYTFSGTASQLVSVNISNSTYTGCSSLAVSILKPDGSTLGSTSLCNTTTGFLNTVTLPTTGTYTAFVNPSGAGTGSVTIQVNTDSDVTGTITPGGAAVTVTTTVAGQDGRLSFSGTAGQRVSLLVSSVSNPYATVYLVKPDGTNQTSMGISAGTGTFFMDTQALATTGTYQLWVQHNSTNVGSETLQLYDVPPDATGSATIAGGPVAVTTTVAGQNASVTFAGTAAQRVSLSLTAGTYSSCSLTLKNPDGSTLTTGNCGGATNFINTVTLGSTGNYTVFVNPNTTSTGTVSVAVNDDSDVTGTIIPGGSAVTTTTTVAGQDARLSFSGTAGQRVSVLVSSVSNPYATVYLVKPDGTNQASMGISSGTGTFFMDTQALATTGTYQLWVQHNSTNVGSETLQLYDVPPDATGPITSGTPLAVTTTTPGQNASYTFSGAVGQQVSVSISASNYPGCSSLVASILKPDGTTLASSSMCGATGFVDSQILPVAGTYSVFINPQGTGAGTATVTLNSYTDVPGTITTGTPLAITIGTPGQKGSITFSGTQGQRVSLNLSSVTISSSTVSIKNPGTLVAGQQYPIKMEYFQGGGGAQAQLFWSSPSTAQQIIPQSQLYPPGSSTADGLQGDYFADTTLSGKPVATRIDPTVNFGWTSLPDPSLSLSLFGVRWTGNVQAQYSENYTFCTVTDDGVRLWINNILVINQWRTQGGTQWCSDTLASASIGTSGGFIDTITLPVTGTYTIVIDPQSSATGNMTLTLNDVPADATATLTPGGAAATTTISTPGQNAQLTFAGTAGQRVSMRVTNVTVPNSTVTIQNTAPLTAGQSYPVEMDYFQGGGGAVAQLNWSSPSTVKQIIPQASLYPPGSSTSGGLNGDYFTNTSLAGTPTLTRTDPTVNFNWSSVSPDPSIPSSNYSVRWTGSIQPAFSEPYRICTNTDDGARLWINGALVVNHWGSQGTTEWCSDNLASTSFGTAGIFVDTVTLPGTGNYQVAVDPQSSGTGSITYTLYDLPPDITGPIAVGTPQTVTTTTPGQNAALTFAGTAGQSVSLQISGSTYTGCTALVFSIINPDRTTLASGSTCSASGSISSHALPATGTYTVLIDPQGATTGSATVSLNSP